ncbi:DUF6998 domain-containing protein [Thalassolituus sp. LLYu03]|uniref:DUF6998 domain-containing protein n=1 Tax=Thalassolituus sp. LLYu03 TaxID=3421656 RepID=UPI003D2E5C52
MRTPVDHESLQALDRQLYQTVGQLEAMFPGRHFTPDGHMVGSLGECLVADAFDLELLTASNRGYDARSRDGRDVEIKATQAKSVAFRHEPEHAVVVKLNKDGTFEVIYNGPGNYIWQCFADKPLPSNGQYPISLEKLRQLDREVPEALRLPRVR